MRKVGLHLCVQTTMNVQIVNTAVRRTHFSKDKSEVVELSMFKAKLLNLENPNL